MKIQLKYDACSTFPLLPIQNGPFSTSTLPSNTAKISVFLSHHFKTKANDHCLWTFKAVTFLFTFWFLSQAVKG